MGTKSLKGTVSVEHIDKRIRLRWRFQQKRYSLNLFDFNRENLHWAKSIAVQIESDIRNNCFDLSLDAYQPVFRLKTVITDKTLVSYFEDWVRNYRNMDCNRDIDYYSTRSMMKKWDDLDIKNLVGNLNREVIAPKTYNRRLIILKAFFDWAKRKEIVTQNPLEDVLPKKTRKTEKPNRRPFSKAEIKIILEAFSKNKFCSPYSAFKHSHYYPFMFFMFKTGVRNAEAIGLRVRDIDFINNQIHIREVLARTIKGSNASARIRKETKNGKQRIIPLTEDLKSLIFPLVTKKQSDDLVFVSHTGKSIDDSMFQRRILKKILAGLKIEHRVLYACRHTFGSRCIEAGINPVTTAFLMGNSPETALRSYTHLISLPGVLPDIN